MTGRMYPTCLSLPFPPSRSSFILHPSSLITPHLENAHAVRHANSRRFHPNSSRWSFWRPLSGRPEDMTALRGKDTAAGRRDLAR